MKKVLLPLPSYGFDPTEAAIPWKILTDQGRDVAFATPTGSIPEPDISMLTGARLGILKPILRAKQTAIDAFHKMEKSEAFKNPIRYQDMNASNFDGLLLSGGHDKRIKEYLESPLVQNTIVSFFNEQKPVGAICHGVIAVARSIDPNTGKSVLHGRKTTALLKSQELLAYNLTRLWLKDYYLTYPGLTVEDEVKSVLSDPNNFFEGPKPILRDDLDHLNRAFVVQDNNYLSARWPGDAHKFSLEFSKMLNSTIS